MTDKKEVTLIQEEIKVKKIVDILKKQQTQINDLIDKYNNIYNVVQQIVDAFNKHTHIATPTIIQSGQVTTQQTDVQKELSELE